MSNILIIKHGSLGDIAQACGAIQDISENHKNDQIHLLTTKPYFDLFKKNPFIHDVILDKRLSRFNLIYLYSLMRKIKKLNVQKAYDLQNSSRTNFYKRILFSNSKPYIIAEIGVNHNNSLSLAKRLIKKAKMHFREYNKYFQQNGFTYAFNPLCKAYLYANSVIDIFSLTDSISTALDMFLNEINIEAEPSKIDNVMPGVKTDEGTKIKATYSNKNIVLKHFKLKARFKKINNAEAITKIKHNMSQKAGDVNFLTISLFPRIKLRYSPEISLTV